MVLRDLMGEPLGIQRLQSAGQQEDAADDDEGEAADPAPNDVGHSRQFSGRRRALPERPDGGKHQNSSPRSPTSDAFAFSAAGSLFPAPASERPDRVSAIPRKMAAAPTQRAGYRLSPRKSQPASVPVTGTRLE